jgi:hypothetical protein
VQFLCFNLLVRDELKGKSAKELEEELAKVRSPAH